jgi:hypothetical protein
MDAWFMDRNRFPHHTASPAILGDRLSDQKDLFLFAICTLLASPCFIKPLIIASL